MLSASPDHTNAPVQTPDFTQVAADVLNAQTAEFTFPPGTSREDMKTRLAGVLDTDKPEGAPPCSTIIEPNIARVTLQIGEANRTLGERFPQLQAVIESAQTRLAGVTLAYN